MSALRLESHDLSWIEDRRRGSAFTGTDRGLLRLVLDPRCSVRECEAPGYLGRAAKVRILRFKSFRHSGIARGLQTHV
jgi:hypothetical protein